MTDVKKFLLDYLPEFSGMMILQLIQDEARWGDTWKKRSREGQEERVYNRYRDYFDQWKNAGTPIPWLKIVGEAFIAWVRENYPDYAEEHVEDDGQPDDTTNPDNG